jgi:uncharacterized repeat protein (TIGR03837 family)
MMRHVGSWDIFCRVVDNYGDIGVCWRLARQLAGERGDTVRLWVDDVPSLARLWPEVVADLDTQHCAGVDIQRWSESLPPRTPHDVVIEAFACKTPDSFAEAMAARTPQSVWINLEYLSAEAWVDGCHLLPSPHPRLPLAKYFFFPGFTSRTGGLLRESDLLARRDAFQRDRPAQHALWDALGLEVPAAGELRMSLFAYSNPAAVRLFSVWAAGDRPVTGVIPEGVLRDEIAGFFGTCPAVGAKASRGKLRLAVIPFLRQSDYDPLLWACDVNLVRGEDSFVRAQWAGRPTVWHIYPQADAAHGVKLDAFLERYCAGQGTGTAAAVRALVAGWNGTGDAAAAWGAAQAALPEWTAGAQAWAAALAAQRDLVSALVEAVETRL